MVTRRQFIKAGVFGGLLMAAVRAINGPFKAGSLARPDEDIALFLERWQHSSIALLRSDYQALHQLIMAAWYGNAQSWRRIGYPGPPAGLQ